MNRPNLLALALMTAAAGLPLQGRAGSAPAESAPVQATAPNADMTDGEVRKVDKPSGKLTLKHADIKNLDMPAMTMVFVVKEPTMLDKLQVGDKVKFRASNDGGKLTVTEIQVVR
jgi:Cu(I)/Ag(I) efflux system protein CusF